MSEARQADMRTLNRPGSCIEPMASDPANPIPYLLFQAVSMQRATSERWSWTGRAHRNGTEANDCRSPSALGTLPECLRHRLDRPHSLTKPGHRPAVPLQFAVGKKSHTEVGDATECWPGELCADFLFAAAGRNEE